MVSAGLASSEASLLGLKMVVFSLCPHMVFLLYVCVSLPKIDKEKTDFVFVSHNLLYLLSES